MNLDRADKDRGRAARSTEWERSERISFWIALAIALMPIPASMLISWALGSPPWAPRRSADPEAVGHAPADPGTIGHGHR